MKSTSSPVLIGNTMTRQDFYNQLLALYADNPEICSALRYASQNSREDVRRSLCRKLWAQAIPHQPGKLNSRHNFWGLFTSKLIWPRAFGVCKMSDEKAAALAEWLHTARNGRNATEIKPTFESDIFSLQKKFNSGKIVHLQ